MDSHIDDFSFREDSANEPVGDRRKADVARLVDIEEADAIGAIRVEFWKGDESENSEADPD